ncbi:restriction endonuclease subunit S [Streptomyces sp. NPDC048106]|uniref:restriction endonuclease subunit S n=1 Tax=Streptomyces sp. NPDC048106 TaxID=3155750 RepID=UPI0034518025
MSKTELPPGWCSVRLEEIAEVRLGRQRSPKNHSGEQMRPYLRAANVDWNGLKLDDVKEMNFTDAELETYRLLPGDIVLGEASGSPREVGKPALWNGQIDDCCFQNTLIRVRPEPGIDPQYLLLLLRYEALSGAFARGARGVGIHHLGSAKLASWSIPLPPLAEQRRIVEVLDDVISRLDAAEKSISRNMKRSGHAWSSVLNAVARGDLNGRSVQADLRLVSEVAEVSGGIQKQQKRRPVDNSFPFLRVANVARGKLQLDEIHQIELFAGELERHRLECGDLLVVEGNGSPDQIGRAATWRGEVDNSVHQNHLIRVRPGGEILPRYLELVWNSPLVVDQLREVARSTSGLYTLSTAKVKSVKIPVPSMSDQKSLVEDADAWETSVDSVRDTLRAAKLRSHLLRQSILRRAFSGSLISQDPVDEPASSIRERIRSAREQAGKRKSSRVRRVRTVRESAGVMPAPSSAIESIPSNAIQQEFEL